MARSITSAFQDEIESQSLTVDILIKAEFDSGDLNLHTGLGTLEYNGDTYIGAGQLLNITSAKETETLQAENMKFTLSGELQSLLSLALQEPYQNRPVNVWFAPIDYQAGTVISNPYRIFRGFMDTMDIADDGTYTEISVNAESELIRYTIPKNVFYTDEVQKARYSGDTGMSYVTLIQDLDIVWGQKDPNEK